MKHHHHDISVGKISHSFFGGIALFVDVITLSSTNMYYTRIVCPYYDDDKRHDKRNDSSRKMQRVHTVRTVRNDRSAHNPPNLRDGGSRSARAYCRPAYVPYRTYRGVKADRILGAFSAAGALLGTKTNAFVVGDRDGKTKL